MKTRRHHNNKGTRRIKRDKIYKEVNGIAKRLGVATNWSWPFLRVNSNGAKEYACPHGVGHGGIHGCDGCCAAPSYPKRRKK